MPERMPESTEKKLVDRLSFYQDMGIGLFYLNRTSGMTTSRSTRPDLVELISHSQNFPEEEINLPKIDRKVAAHPAPAPPKIDILPVPAGPSLFESMTKVADDSLLKIRDDLGECTRCKLHKTRHKIVFGDGNPKAQLVFVGEGPGHDEDMQGLPFVGRAGKLLTQMIEAMGLERKDVYICNVVKCRPPENRTPLPEEMEICGEFLFRQLMTIRPKAICALGSTAAKAILNTKDGVTRLRGKWHKWRDIPVIVTFHPSYLLRPYNQEAKREAWEDLKKVLHFVYD
jgi:uracil-DNA glycosylase